MKWIFSFLWIVWGSLVLGTEILSVDFKPELRYRDIERACEFSPQVRLFSLTAELDGEKIIRARLRKNSKYSKEHILDLDESEMKNILAQDTVKGPKALIQRFEASERMLRFFFYEAFVVESPCVPRDSLVDFAPSSAIFEYRLPDPTTDPFVYDDVSSNVVVFKGTNVKQQFFQIELSLTQAD